MDGSLTSHCLRFSFFVLHISNDQAAVEEAETWIDWYQNFLPKDQSADEPVSDLYYPVINQLQQIDSSNSDGEMVAMISTSIYWRDMLQAISLSSDRNALDIVFENECNPSFTFGIV
jgi:hypothetical protein